MVMAGGAPDGAVAPGIAESGRSMAQRTNPCQVDPANGLRLDLTRPARMVRLYTTPED
jgi:hypothetical protein